MSLLGRKPIPIPDGVTVTVADGRVNAQGPKGSLSVRVPPELAATVDGSQLWVKPQPGRENAKGVSALWGTQWALVRNVIQGVSQGFVKQLELHGVGYRAEISGNALKLIVGFSHPVELVPPEGVAATVEKNVITVAGVDKSAVGEFAAAARRVRPPEPYKGKGIRYVGEVVRRKVGKVVGATGAAGA